MDLTPTIYRVGGLRYFLIAGETSWLESLRIIDSRQRSWANREVTFYALGASHALSVRQDDRQVTELLSCSGSFRKAQCLAEMAINEAIQVSTVINDMRYSFRLTLHNLHGNDVLLRRYPKDHEITIAYPRRQGSDTPVTRIGWLEEPRALRLETLHTYPEEGRGVRTESIIDIA